MMSLVMAKVHIVMSSHINRWNMLHRRANRYVKDNKSIMMHLSTNRIAIRMKRLNCLHGIPREPLHKTPHSTPSITHHHHPHHHTHHHDNAHGFYLPQVRRDEHVGSRRNVRAHCIAAVRLIKSNLTSPQHHVVSVVEQPHIRTYVLRGSAQTFRMAVSPSVICLTPSSRPEITLPRVAMISRTMRWPLRTSHPFIQPTTHHNHNHNIITESQSDTHRLTHPHTNDEI